MTWTDGDLRNHTSEYNRPTFECAEILCKWIPTQCSCYLCLCCWSLLTGAYINLSTVTLERNLKVKYLLPFNKSPGSWNEVHLTASMILSLCLFLTSWSVQVLTAPSFGLTQIRTVHIIRAHTYYYYSNSWNEQRNHRLHKDYTEGTFVKKN